MAHPPQNGSNTGLTDIRSHPPRPCHPMPMPTLDALPKRTLTGKVRRVAPYVSAVEKQARTVDVEVDFERPAGVNLLVGYSADVEIVLSSHPNVLRVPTAALIEGSKVMVLNADSGRLEERKVRTGMANWEFTEIVEGLAEGERIVMSLEREGVKVGASATAATAAADAKAK